MFIQESELYEKLQLAAELDPESSRYPALMLLQEFLSVSPVMEEGICGPSARLADG
jgi:hypothetical protein